MAGDMLSPQADAPLPGEYVVVARRYRPQTFTDLVGQSQVSQALSNAIATGRVGHAYLFTGARGVGKTSTARIFAKCLNCVRGPTTSPCGLCDICQGVASGDDVDVIEIDGASNRGIDEIRQLRQNVNVRPSRARFKIYIIDEVHMLTTPAFNALLKTLEEPPEHVKFIFCTTEADKIPITVLSRCQRFDFAPIETRSILERLRQIAASEGVEAEEEALSILARRAAGSMRDSQSLLEQLLSFGGKRITADDVNALLGTAKSSRLAAVVQAVIRRDAAAALAEVDAAIREGVDVGQLAEQLVGYFRDMLAALVGCPPDLLLHVSAAEVPQVKAAAESLGLETLLAMVQILDQAVTRMRQSTHVRTLAEIALVRICKLEDLEQLPLLVAQLRDGEAAPPPARLSASPAPIAVASGQNPGPGGAGPPAAVEGSRQRATSAERSDQKKTLRVDESEPLGAVSDADPTSVQPAGLWLDKAAEIWSQALAILGDMTSDFASKAESVAICGPNRLVARFGKAYSYQKEFCERPERKALLEQALCQAAGVPITLQFEVLSDRGGPVPVARETPLPNRQQRFAEAARHPLVRQAMEHFDAEIVRVFQPATESAAEGEGPGESAAAAN
jgi:DNA polymerase-3 subunit gamma/tau